MRAGRRDYQELVKVIRRLEKGTTKRLMWGHAIANVLRKSNPRFDEQRFIMACGADDEPGNVVSFSEEFEKK
jgi:hypothetical protein